MTLHVVSPAADQGTTSSGTEKNLHLDFQGKRIKWLILPLHESETDRHLIGLSG